MPDATLRLIVKQPTHAQVTPNEYENTTRYLTFECPCPPGLFALFTKHQHPDFFPVVVGAELVPEGQVGSE